GVFVFRDETSSSVAPAKLYKALTKDSDTIAQKIDGPIQSIELVEGNGGVGTIKKITANEGDKTSFVLQKVDAIDEANLGYDYSIVGGTGLPESLEKLSFETKVVAGSGGGSISKVTLKFHTKGDAPLSDAVRDDALAKGAGFFKAIEGYVLANPAEY
uniref:pathogenesis-related class 10 protein SPE-16 n=1 Tax=Pachyrhizus erosus TaxID=109171 RepID=UPI00005C9395|nr:Chain A, pathogenesis-related class 10 protein SPE-16 [Pachyrhizus erosus]1TW0_B Chain B, pathogenesis-related class 10 protein SPE-16 [Pachyrhizus erosus]1TXC_A Chain A, pathogenesis-related class 10 protein SPE-16 [Pachyrhizus erosus]1TXC_B Chain B, pathogenesis-related class 10 protein SPE-16 [Pachyrhizus erosus]